VLYVEVEERRVKESLEERLEFLEREELWLSIFGDSMLVCFLMTLFCG
jgi:hypothetical protein